MISGTITNIIAGTSIMYDQNHVHTIRNPVRPESGLHPIFVIQNNKIMKHEYLITGMTCNHCVEDVNNRLAKVNGITHAQVSLNPPRAILEMTDHVDTKELQNSLAGTKFAISDLHIEQKAHHQVIEEESPDFLTTYKPIILVFAFILGITFLTELVSGSFEYMRWMRHFMAGFFLVFSFFKLLDLPSFAASYSTYDVLAKRWLGWGYIYPFVELGLGILFLINFQPLFTSIATLIVMAVSSIGVIQSLLEKRKIKCACLGAVFNLPMSSITLTEDLLMVIMSGFMIFHLI
jgi:copper chaperone CopZ